MLRSVRQFERELAEDYREPGKPAARRLVMVLNAAIDRFRQREGDVGKEAVREAVRWVARERGS